MSLGINEIDQFYKQYFPIIRSKCRRMLTDLEEAQDVAQETFVRLWRADLSGRSPPQIIAWIYQTSTRLAVDRLRERKARPPASEQAIEAQEHAPAHDNALATRQLLGKVARRIPKDDLEFLILQRIDGMKDEELAQLLGVSDRTVRRRAAALDERLHRIVAELDHGA